MFLTTALTKNAYLIACDAHFGQVDKAGDPYILHPIFLAHQFNDEKLVAAALLHDVIEDSNWTETGLLERNIPPEVVNIVSVLTRKDKEKYFDYIERISHNPDAVKIKLADLRHNSDLSRLGMIAGQDLSRKKRYLKAINILEEVSYGSEIKY